MDVSQQFKNSLRQEFGKAMSTKSASGDIDKDFNYYLTSVQEDTDSKEELKGGKADKHSLNSIASKHKVELIKIAKQFIKGFSVELEHSNDQKKVADIVMDHLVEDPNYYDKLKRVETKEQIIRKKTKSGLSDKILGKSKKMDKPIGKLFSMSKSENKEATGSGSSGAFSGPIAFKDSEFLRKSFAETPGKLKESSMAGEVEKVETKEATTSGSVGGYETPAMWAKSTKKKDWGPSRKTQYHGGSFVKVKKKCTKFPYCNQGDINAVQLSKNESVKEAIKNVSKRTNISEKVIISILENEYKNLRKKNQS